MRLLRYTPIALLAALTLSACATLAPGPKPEKLVGLPDTLSVYVTEAMTIGATPSDEPQTGLSVAAGTRLLAREFDGEYFRVTAPPDLGAGNARFYIYEADVERTPAVGRYLLAYNRLAAAGLVSADPFGRTTVAAGAKLYRGPRGGCYYLSGSGGKVYVARSLCDARENVADQPTPTTYTPATPSGSGPVRVRGYTRRDGTYVRPHTRSRPRRN